MSLSKRNLTRSEATRIQPWRSKLLLSVLSVGFLVLFCRAVWLQVLSPDYLKQEADSRFIQTQTLQATRGKILDRNGVVLASSLPARSIGIHTNQFAPDKEQTQALAKLLSISTAELQRRVAAGANRPYFYLQRQVDPAIAEGIAKLKIRGIDFHREYKRLYPGGEASAQIIGFTNIDDTGVEGIEHAFQKVLVGQAGTRRVTRTRLGQTIDEDESSVELPTAGRDIELSIDTRLQDIAFAAVKDAVRENRAAAGSAIVIDAKNGEILALANWPSYNPNQRKGVSTKAMRNRALVDTFEPGSTLKPFTAALALETGKLKPHTVIQTAPGRLTIGPNTISDSRVHGALTVEQIVQKSSNVGTAKIATELLGREPLWRFLTQSGLGEAPQIGFPGTASGRVRPHKSWRPIELATISYGYGISASLLQLARGYTMFANDGQLMPISIVKRTGPVEGIRMIKPENALAIRKMLEMATNEEGTAPKAQIVGYRVAGKTGTARKQKNGQYTKDYIASFVGFAPASDPKVIIAVMIDEPSSTQYYGGEVAAPVFARIAEDSLRILKVAPDAPFKTRIEIPQNPVKESI